VPKQLKQLLANQVVGALKGNDGAVFVNMSAMTVEQSTALRGLLISKAGGARMRVLHNRTARVALRSAGWPSKVESILKGPTAVVYGGEGPSSIAKTLGEWSRTDKTKSLVLKGAVAEGEFFDAKGVVALAKMPDKKTLRAMIAQAILGPSRGLAVALAANAAGLARVTQARIDKQGFPEQG